MRHTTLMTTKRQSAHFTMTQSDRATQTARHLQQKEKSILRYDKIRHNTPVGIQKTEKWKRRKDIKATNRKDRRTRKDENER